MSWFEPLAGSAASKRENGSSGKPRGRARGRTNRGAGVERQDGSTRRPGPPDEPEAATETEFDRLRRLALEAEAQGKARAMRDPKIRLRPPNKPTSSW